MAISFPMQQKVAVKAFKMENVALVIKIHDYTVTNNKKKKLGNEFLRSKKLLSTKFVQQLHLFAFSSLRLSNASER